MFLLSLLKTTTNPNNMIKEIIKPLIIGISIIVGVLIYTEQTKYELIDNDTDNGGVNHLLLNKRSGEVRRFYLNGSEETMYLRTIDINGNTTKNKTEIIDNTIEE